MAGLAKQHTSETSYWSAYFIPGRHGTFVDGSDLTTPGRGGGKKIGIAHLWYGGLRGERHCNRTFVRSRSGAPGRANVSIPMGLR